MPADISEEEAIRRVLAAGGFADYVDVAQAVEKQFGLRVGAAKVEATVLAAREETRSDTADAAGQDGGAGNAVTPPAPDSAADATEDATAHRNTTLRFVESMGGFPAARKAIAELEESLKKIMK